MSEITENNEIKVSLVFIPESYDYGVEDIVYRIWINLFFKKEKQLIMERSMPILSENEAVVDLFFLNNYENENYNIFIHCPTLKKVIVSKMIINDQPIENFKIAKNYYFKKFTISINSIF